MYNVEERTLCGAFLRLVLNAETSRRVNSYNGLCINYADPLYSRRKMWHSSSQETIVTGSVEPWAKGGFEAGGMVRRIEELVSPSSCLYEAWGMGRERKQGTHKHVSPWTTGGGLTDSGCGLILRWPIGPSKT